MSSETFWSCAAAMFTHLTGLVYVVLLVDRWRYSLRIRICVITTAATAMQVTIAASFLLMDDLAAANAVAAVLDAASLGLVLILAPWRSGRLLFVLGVTYTLATISNIISHMAFLHYGPGNLSVRAVTSLLLILWVCCSFRPNLHSIFQWGEGSMWYLLSLIPLMYNVMFFIEVMIFFTNRVPLGPPRSTSLFHVLHAASGSALVLVMTLCIYIAFQKFFQVLNEHFLAQKVNATLNARITSIRHNRENGRKQQEREQNFIQDLDVILNRIEASLEQDHTAEALSALHQIDDLLLSDRQKNMPPQYTGCVVLDAVIADYEEQAISSGIETQCRFNTSLPKGTDTTGLAVVLSNALENAINACMNLPAERARWIHISLNGTLEQCVLQIQNSYGGSIDFDPISGCPASRLDGHGYGTRSMKIFADENDAVLQFAASDCVFTMNLML